MNKKITSACVEDAHTLFVDIFADQLILLKDFLINMRLIDIIKWARVDKEDVSFTIPAKYHSKIYNRLYLIYKIIYRLFIFNFR
jgi:hypothetical protein